MPDDIDMPNTWHKEKRTSNAVDFNKKEVENLFKFVGKFFARNKVRRLCTNKKVLSLNEQDVRSDDQTCLWLDGVTYCKTLCSGQVLLHKTFLPYWKNSSVKDDAYLGEDQLKAIASDLAHLHKEASEAFPLQYGDVGFNWFDFVAAHRWIGESLSPISSVQNAAWPYLERWEKAGLISITGNEPPKFDHKELSAATSLLQRLSTITANGVDERELAKSVMVIVSSLWWHLRDFENWYTENGRLAVLNEPEGLQVIRLMRGTNLREVILSEGDLLSKTYEELNKLLSNQ